MAKSQLFEERAKKLGERFGLDINPSEWQTTSTDETVLRMDKPIRMRVRRSCHRCNTTFSTAKECPNCQHVRCSKCTRYPRKRTEAELIASRERRAAIIQANKENAPIIPDYDLSRHQNIVLKRPSKTGGQDLVHKKPRQRVRRTCHECHNIFRTGSKTCEKCSHIRCTDCPRDPLVTAAPNPCLRRAFLTSDIDQRGTSIPSDTPVTFLARAAFPTTSARCARPFSQRMQKTARLVRSAARKRPTLLPARCHAKSSQNQTQRF